MKLYRVVALRMSAVPVPLMLKLLAACWLVLFCRKPLAAKPPSCAALMA